MADSIFNQFIEKRKVITKNKKVLQTTYVPNVLPHRSEQINKLASIISIALNGEKPSNIMVYGKTGTGKTAVLNYIGKELKKADENESTCQYIYVNCEIVDTPYSVLYNIGNQIILEDSKRIPFTGWSFEKVYSELVNYINTMNKVFIIVLDEIDKLIDKKGDDIFYYIAKINENLYESRVSIIGISNNMKFMEFLEPKARSRLGGESIVFPPYKKEELEDILQARVQEAFDPNVIDESVIIYCASIAAKEDGDARIAIDLLKTAADIAERNGDAIVTEAHVKSAKNSIEFDIMSEAIKTLAPQSKLVLISIIKNTENGNGNMTTGDVYKTYQNISSVVGTSTLSQRRIGDLISELDSIGIITASIRSFGRAGRSRVIQLSIDRTNIEKFKKEDPTFAYLEDYTPPLQTKII
ncbi:MAG: AAA family ATPase [Thermoplasmata archaeon]|nr:AAA family ATPase [Thermoplasmata archaeon]